MNTAARVLVGMAVAAGAVYLLDPVSGHRRRLLLRDEGARAARRMELGTRDARHDASERVHAVTSWTKSRLAQDQTRDKAVLKRVREAIRALASHPGSIDVAVDEGHVILRGNVYTHEHQQLLNQISHVTGVRVVTDHLTARETAEGLASLDAGHAFRTAAGPGGWTVAGRVMAACVGCALLAWGVKERRTLGEFGESLWRKGKEEFEKGLRSGEEALDTAQDVVTDVAAKAQDAVDAARNTNFAEYAQARRRQGDSGPETHAQSNS
jgi:hypothetical protein